MSVPMQTNLSAIPVIQQHLLLGKNTSQSGTAENTKKKKSDSEKGHRRMFDEELDKYETYEEYLDSLVSDEDHKYLEDEEMARQIAELGYRSSGDTLTRENFYKLKARIAEARLLTMNHQHQINNCGNENDNGKGHIDLAQRMKSENFLPYINGEKRLIPQRGDLTFYNWCRGTAFCKSSENFDVIAEMPKLRLCHRATKAMLDITTTNPNFKLSMDSRSTRGSGWQTIETTEDGTHAMIFDIQIMENDSTDDDQHSVFAE